MNNKEILSIDEELADKIIKENIPNGIVNIHANGKGNGKPQYQAENNIIKKCMEQYTNSKLEELEKWVDEKTKYQFHHDAFLLEINQLYQDLKDKITSLKQKS